MSIFFVCGVRALQARGDLRRLERFWSSTIHNSETLTHEITFEIPPKKRHFFFFDEKQNKTNRRRRRREVGFVAIRTSRLER
jgi:hypothetical protein